MKALPIVILYGALSFANPGVLERVATNRAAGLTDYSVPANWTEYDVLLAVEDCKYVGNEGKLYVDNGQIFTALIVDCQADEHKAIAPMSSLGLLADVNKASLVHHKAVFLKKQTRRILCQSNRISGLKE